MSTYLGNQLLSGVATNTISNAHSLFDFKWTDHILNEMSWLRSDTFSWHNGDLYKAAYDHLANDYENGESSYDEINGITVWFRIAPDGHKIVNENWDESEYKSIAVEKIYNSVGVSWYYIIDKVNKRFKLPRINPNREELIQVVRAKGDGKTLGLTDGTLTAGLNTINAGNTGTLIGNPNQYSQDVGHTDATNTYLGFSKAVGITADSTKSGIISSMTDSTSVYKGNKYLYFYVGEYSQSQAEQVATLNVEMFNNKADKNLVNTGYLTNCITEIPQDINLELNDGVLTLKTGSKVYIPNGFEQDGTTPKFDTVTLQSDYVNNTTGNEPQLFLSYHNVNDDLDSFLFAGLNGETVSTRPNNPTEYALYYITSTNTIEEYDNGAWHSGYSLPIGLTVRTNSGFSSIDQVFNGFGYIGSTMFVLPGLRGLLPNGRNEDGTLKNMEFNIHNVMIYTSGVNELGYYFTDGNQIYWIAVAREYHEQKTMPSGLPAADMYGLWYNPDTNLMLRSWNNEPWTKVNWTKIGNVNGSSNKITSFSQKTSFHALDWNDSPTIARFSLPSNKNVSLTIGESGSAYIAPANGWFCLNVLMNGSNTWILLTNETKDYFKAFQWCSSGQQETGIYIPASRGDRILLSYNTTISYESWTNGFRFFFAEGEL